MTEPSKVEITQEIALDDLQDAVTTYKAARAKVEQWTDVANTFRQQIEDAVTARAGEWSGTEGKRTTYVVVDGERVGSYTEFLSETFDKKKARENHPEVIDEFTIRKPKKTFRIG